MPCMVISLGMVSILEAPILFCAINIDDSFVCVDVTHIDDSFVRVDVTNIVCPSSTLTGKYRRLLYLR